MSAEPIYADPYTRIAWLQAERDRLAAELAEARPSAETRDYLTRTIATIRNHRDADNCWPQWANLLADEVERMWAAVSGRQQGPKP